MSPLMLALIVILILGAGIGITFALLRYRYVRAIEAKGWTFTSNPSLRLTYGLNCAPFGRGFDRKIDDLISGEFKDEISFRCFLYRSSADPQTSILALPLPHSMPADAVAGLPVELAQGERISVDHEQLLLIDAPRHPDELEQALARLSAVRAALLASPAAEAWGPTPPDELSFAGHNDWVYRGRDDDFLALVSTTQGGQDHEAHNVIFSTAGPLPFVRLTHRWTTREHSIDAKGNSTTTTRRHSEDLCEFSPTFAFLPLSANWGLWGRSQKFEWEEFNRRVRINASNERFASDVIHQRMMEYLLRWDAPSFRIKDGTISFAASTWQPTDIDAHARFLTGFFARVPDHVYLDLGVQPRPVPRALTP